MPPIVCSINIHIYIYTHSTYIYTHIQYIYLYIYLRDHFRPSFSVSFPPRTSFVSSTSSSVTCSAPPAVCWRGRRRRSSAAPWTSSERRWKMCHRRICRRMGSDVPGFFMVYPLVNIQKTMENHHFLWENSLFLWPFSIAMLVYQRVEMFRVCRLPILHDLFFLGVINLELGCTTL